MKRPFAALTVLPILAWACTSSIDMFEVSVPTLLPTPIWAFCWLNESLEERLGLTALATPVWALYKLEEALEERLVLTALASPK